MRASLALATTVVVVVAGGCGSKHAPATPPVSFSVGVFTVTVAPDTASLSVLGPAGVSLLDGIPSSNDVGTPQSMNDDAPPMTGFAVRDLATSYTMAGGSFLVADDTTQPWRVVTRAAVTGNQVDLFAGGTRVASLAASQGDDADHLVVAVTPGDDAPTPSSDPTTPRRRISWGFGCTADDHFAGFGAQTWGVDARGETIPIWMQEEGIGKDLTTDDPTGVWPIVGRRHSAYMPLPEFLARRGYVAVADTAHRSTFALCSERGDVARMELELPVTVNLFYGPDPHAALSGATAHYGRPRVPPAFAFAPWNDAIFGSANVRRVAEKLREVGAPSSVIWTEDWRGGSFTQPDVYQLKEEWDVDRTLYPDFESVAAYLHGGGFKWLVYFNSFVEQDSAAWPETAPNGYLVTQADGTPYTFGDALFKPASLVDLTQPAAVAWAVGKMNAAIALGADGWMGDFGEWLPTDATLTGGAGLDEHAGYSLLWQKAQRQALDESIAADGVERLSFVRSGALGTSALADVFWAGDQRTDFEVDDGMPTVLPIGIGVGLSGVSTFGSDIAGYQSFSNPTSTKELFFRWTELGAWSPVMRTHHGTEPNLEWSWESDDDSTAQWVRYAKLHMALAPTMRGLAQAAHDTGISIWRPLAVEFPNDAASWPVADEVMVGPGLLVAPVQVAGATSRSVYLPPGTWFPWGGGPSAPGGATITASAAVAEIPVFALAGTIVSMYPDGVETLTVEPALAVNAESVADDRLIYAFAGGTGQLSEAPDAGGLSYSLAVAPSGAPTWNGVALGACDASMTAPCATQATGEVTSYVVGPGELVAGGATLTCTGGASNRALTLILRF
jgi:alpha-glucosidase